MDVNFELSSINEVAGQLLKHHAGAKVFAFAGDMGAGKTTFIHALCTVLGVKDAISSPTYSIINQYRGKDEQVIFHMDLYRLKDEEEAVNAGVEDCLYSGHTCFVEWPERAPDLFPEGTIHIKLSVGDNNTRKIAW